MEFQPVTPYYAYGANRTVSSSRAWIEISAWKSLQQFFGVDAYAVFIVQRSASRR
jgi:hypothetical protein